MNKTFCVTATIGLLLLSSLIVIPVSSEDSIGVLGDNTLYVDDDNTQGLWDGTQQHPYQCIQYSAIKGKELTSEKSVLKVDIQPGEKSLLYGTVKSTVKNNGDTPINNVTLILNVSYASNHLIRIILYELFEIELPTKEYYKNLTIDTLEPQESKSIEIKIRGWGFLGVRSIAFINGSESSFDFKSGHIFGRNIQISYPSW
jgi:hypothetical protein